MRRSWIRISAVVLVVLGLFAVPAVAAEISGVVLGPGAEPLPGATVTVTGVETGASTSATTDDRGRYQVTGLVAGTYRVTAELAGFGSVTRDGVVVGADGATGLDLALRPQAAGSITVTARKVEEDVRDVPISISTVSTEEIEQRNAFVFTDAFKEVPNVVVEGNNTWNPGIIIRGISSDTNNVGIEPAISVYLDETFLPRPGAFEQSLIDIERVEVLRGPQGTAYGKNSIGGAVNIVTTKPGAQPRGTLELAYGSYDLTQVRGFYGGPISGDKLSAQVSLSMRQRDGWFENRTEGEDDLMADDYYGGRGQLRFTPSDKTDILVTMDYAKDESVQNAMDLSGGALYPVDGMDGWDRSIATTPSDLFDREVMGGSLRGDFTLGRHLLTSLTGYRAFEQENLTDQDYTYLDILATSRREELEFFSEELRLASISGGDFSYLAGLFFSDRTTDGRDRAKLGAALPPLLGLPYIPGYNEWASAISTIEEQVVAGFFSGSWAFSERAAFSFGARYTSEDKSIDYQQVIEPFFIAPGVPIGIVYFFGADVAPVSQDRSDSDPSGDLNLVYRLSDEVNGYARYAHGFKAGGFDSTTSATADPGDLEFDSETIDAYELGIKTLAADGQVQLNAALFYMDYQDKQEQFFDGFNFRTGNAAAATSQGADLELRWLPASGLEILATAGYTDAVYDVYVDELTGDDFSGNRLPGVPEWTGSLAVQYFSPFAGSMAWFIRGAAYYRSENFSDSDNNPTFLQEAHTLVDARVGLDLKNGRYSVAVWGKNLTEEDYILGGTNIFGTNYQQLNPPRTFGVELRLRR